MVINVCKDGTSEVSASAAAVKGLPSTATKTAKPQTTSAMLRTLSTLLITLCVSHDVPRRHPCGPRPWAPNNVSWGPAA